MSPVITNGPGKLSTALGITKEWNGMDLTDQASPIIIVDGKIDRDYGPIDAGPRVGMSHHTKHCGHYPWRFKFSNNKWTSKPDKVAYDW